MEEIPEEDKEKEEKGEGKYMTENKIPPELEPLAREARKYKSAEEFVKAFYQKLEKQGMSIQGWDWDKPTGVVRYIIEFPYQEGAIKTGYSVTIDKPVSEEEYRLSIRRENGDLLSEWDLNNINLNLKDYFDQRLFKGDEIKFSTLEDAINKVKKIFPKESSKKDFSLLKIKEPDKFYNLATKGVKETVEERGEGGRVRERAKVKIGETLTDRLLSKYFKERGYG